MQVPHRSHPAVESRSLRDRMPDALESTALALFGLSVLILVSLLLDPPSRTVRGAGGGFFLSREPFLLLGAGTYLTAGLVGFWSAIIFFNHRIHNLALKAFGVLLTAVTFSTLLSLGSSEWMTEVYYGGYVGSFIKQAFEGVSPLISMPLIGILFLIAVVFATDWFFYELIKGDARDADLSGAGRRLVPGVSADEERALIVRTPVAQSPAAVEPEEAEEAEAELWEDDLGPGEGDDEEVELESEPEAPAPPAPAEPTGPRIMRRIFPELEPVRPVAEREEGGEEETEVETEREVPAAWREEGPEEAETEERPAAATATDWAGFKLFLPDSDDEDREEAPREFTGRIAAYLEEDEDEEALDEERAERAEPGLEAEFETAEEELEPAYEEAEDEEETEAPEEPRTVAAPPDVIADWVVHDEEEPEEDESALLETETVDATEEDEFEVIATLDEPHTARPLSDEDEDEDEETEEDADEEEVIRIEFDEDGEDATAETGPGPARMLYSEAFHTAAPARVETDEEEAAQPDPFADAPVTGETDDEAPEPRTRRSRRAAARLELAIEDLIPSLDRMKKKIADLETEPRDESAGERIYDLALDTVFRSKRASTGLLRKELDLDARTAAGLLERMEQDGVVGPRRDKRGNRKVLISRRDFEELRSTGRR